MSRYLLVSSGPLGRRRAQILVNWSVCRLGFGCQSSAHDLDLVLEGSREAGRLSGAVSKQARALLHFVMLASARRRG